MQNKESKIETIVQEVFSQVRATIVLNMRFLDMAVFRLRPAPENVTLATDGDCLYYHPIWLLKRYQEESNAVTHDYMHVLLHCIFRHPFVHTLINQPLWDLSCDIAVEAMISDFNIQHMSTRQDVARQTVIDYLHNRVKPLTAEKLYHYFQDHAPSNGWAKMFHADEHEIWYRGEKPAQPSKQGQGKGETKDDQEKSQQQPNKSTSEKKDENLPDDQQAQNPDSQRSDDQTESLQSNESSDDSSHNGDLKNQQTSEHGPGNQADDPQQADSQSSDSSPSRYETEKEWQDISEHVQMDMETFAKVQGIQAGSMQQMLKALNREHYDYEAFLKKFAVLGETMKINDDEFDYIFYTYGLKLYKRMPLIEPLEYKDVKRIREFVIAIDTSGSTSGELVEKFLNKTFNILMSTESFFSKVNIHIIQCDSEIQDSVKITKQEDFEKYLKQMTIHGLGGTDFRPVFSYVNQLIREGEFKNLKGLIYFTDGFGVFPESKPDYTAAFVFIQDEYNNLSVPPWAIKLILEKDEI